MRRRRPCQVPASIGRGQRSRAARVRSRHSPDADRGFTFIELMIVITIVPLIIGGLAAGLLAVFSLQSGVSSRLSNTSDAQMVTATYANDVQSAQNVTTAAASSPQCGTGNQLLGLEWNENQTSHQYLTVVSYVSQAVVSGGTTTYSLVRLFCNGGSLIPSSQTTISYNIASATAITPPVISPSKYVAPAAGGWISAQQVTDVTLPVAEPEGKAGTFSYTLSAVPARSASQTDLGAPIAQDTSTSCGFAYAGSGPYAGNLCFIDFSFLTGNTLLAAEENCVETSVLLPGGYTMYFCLGIAGAPIFSYTLPTWEYGFLGNSGSYNGQQTGVTPNYYNITNLSGGLSYPALYQSCEGGNVSTGLVTGTNVNGCNVPGDTGGTNGSGLGITTLTFSKITVVNAANGQPATNWEVFSADAESTDPGESLVWTTGSGGPAVTVLNNGYAWDSSGDPVGTACNAGAGLTGSGTNTVQCSGNNTQQSKTGATIVEAQTPTTVTITMTGTGLEGVAFGVFL
ncbi:MAG: prepilin-type N-terminal cleavage/methylation domain-containing protein [Acidimicrobiales bacterium]